MSSWPHIRLLKLSSDPRLPPSTVTFRGLFAALRLRPQLEDLQISIDTVNIDIDPEAESFQHTSLKILHFSFSFLEEANAEVIARIIFSMLPCVDEVDAWESEDWREVNSYPNLLNLLWFSTAVSQEQLQIPEVGIYSCLEIVQ
ncbi:uncharacterized protein EDB91DRAFT_1174964 [Suillus paluster]|uniref:uncharacterized protein n=1 Tax=Suillus paluster TaxID=48578 RepID=UPI001B87DA11|nr:uncharacterized protein EDB91DRAFT_1174964 [Suillus paluster]KAG1722212.1 hypothetical protein EDB91DRAFT_1174964 [Suillus paluster]